MSVNMGDERSTAYSDFEHQNIALAIGYPPRSGNSLHEVNFDPLEDRGGLDSDEVAEVVAVRFSVHVNLDGGTSTNLEFRGAYGANLDAPEDMPGSGPGGLSSNNNNKIADSEVIEENTGGIGPGELSSVEENGIFVDWDIAAAQSSTGMSQRGQINMREYYGRGPVLDTTDDLSIIFATISDAGDDAEGVFRAQMVYDTATVEGVRSRFSVPKQLE